MTTEKLKYDNIKNKYELIKFVNDSGSLFFSRKNCILFDTRFETTVVQNHLFILSSAPDELERKYTIYQLHSNGEIKNISEIFEFPTFSDAINALRRIQQKLKLLHRTKSQLTNMDLIF